MKIQEARNNTWARNLELALEAHRSNNLELAESIYLLLLKEKTEEVVLYHLGVLNLQLGKHEEAKRFLLAAIQLEPKKSRSYTALALLLEREGLVIEAAEKARVATELSPENHVVWNNLSKIQITLGLYSEALNSTKKSLELNQKNFEARFNRALATAKLGDISSAIEDLEKLKLEFGDRFDIHNKLGALYCEIGLNEQGFLSLCKAYELICNSKNSPKIIFEIGESLLRLLTIPIVHQHEQSLYFWRTEIFKILQKTEALLAQASDQQLEENHDPLLFCCLRISNFYVPYLSIKTIDFHRRYFKIVRHLFKKFEGNSELNLPSDEFKKHRKIKFGVLSEYFGLHATQWIGDLLSNSNLPNTEITFYVLNDWKDSAYINKLSSIAKVKFLTCNEENFGSTLKILRAEQIDLLIYPDIGMTATSRLLSCFRIGRKQLVHWAHPDTTGSDSIDYFLSAENMEQPNSTADYSEELLTLPNFGLYLPKPQSASTQSANRYPDVCELDTPSILSIQSLFKYLPSYDWVYFEILKNLPAAKLYFIRHPSDHVTSVFLNRLRITSNRYGIQVDNQISIIERMCKDDLIKFLSKGTVCLDSIGWSGGNTCLDAISAGCPVLTVPGEFMRSRHTFAALKVLGLEELIARDTKDLIVKSIAFCTDINIQRRVRQKLCQVQFRLFEDRAVLKEFEREMNKILRSQH